MPRAFGIALIHPGNTTKGTNNVIHVDFAARASKMAKAA